MASINYRKRPEVEQAANSPVFGIINESSKVIQNNIVHYTQNLNTASAGISSIKIISSSVSQSHWDSLNVLFYSSGSVRNPGELKLGAPSSNFADMRTVGTQYLNKYHGYPSSSIITIPSKYYGEKIKQKTFKLTDSNNTDGAGVKPEIIDDGFGNLYSTNAHHSQSTSAASSSDNYVGNIFYEHGLAVITETGSWSGSVDYSDLATNFELQFDSVNTIYNHEYNVTIRPEEYNLTMNYGIRAAVRGGTFSLSTSTMASTYTGSNFQPYITTINLYQQGDYDTPVIQATFPRPIRKSDIINTSFKIKLDI
mgnify:CR=1 FL=1